MELKPQTQGQQPPQQSPLPPPLLLDEATVVFCATFASSLGGQSKIAPAQHVSDLCPKRAHVKRDSDGGAVGAARALSTSAEDVAGVGWCCCAASGLAVARAAGTGVVVTIVSDDDPPSAGARGTCGVAFGTFCCEAVGGVQASLCVDQSAD